MTEEIKKLREEMRPKDLHFQCGENVCAAHGSWEKGFDAAIVAILNKQKSELKQAVKYSYQCNLDGVDTEDHDKILIGLQAFARDVERICK